MHRADLFAFGYVLYEAVTGRQAFAGKSVPDTLSRIVHEEPAPIVEVNESSPFELQRIARKCLSKQRAKRYQSAGSTICRRSERRWSYRADRRLTTVPPRR